jgi:hypothetical protein
VIDYKENGTIVKKEAGAFLIDVIHKLSRRFTTMQMIVFPETYKFYFTKSERETIENIGRLRNLFKDIIAERKS